MKVTKATREALRKELAAKGYPPEDIALVMVGTYQVRIRLALRWAHGMTLQDVADEWNQQDASGRASMTAARISDHERWPDGGKRPTAYVLLKLAKIYQTAAPTLLDDRDYAALNEKQLFEAIELRSHHNTDDAPPTAQVSATTPPQMPRRKIVQGLSAMATGAYLESIDLVRQAEASDLGPKTLEQLDHTVERLGLEYVGTPPAKTLEEARGTRQYVIELLNGKQTLAQKTHLYHLAGWLSALLGHAAFDLGQNSAVHHTTALHFAEEVGDAKLTAWVRGTQAMVAIYKGCPDEAAQFSQAGRQAAPTGSAAAVRLSGLEARAYSRMNTPGPAEQAMVAAERAFDRLTQQPDHSVFSFDRPFLLFYAGTTYVGLRQAKRARECTQQTIALCDVRPADWSIMRVLSRVDLATALAQQDDLEGAGELGAEALHICGPGQRTMPAAARFAELLRTLRPHRDVSAIRDFEEQFHVVFPQGKA